MPQTQRRREHVRWKDTEIGPDPTGMPAPVHREASRLRPAAMAERDGTSTEYFCEDGTSRDAYAGVIFGLLTAFDLVGTDDPAIRVADRATTTC